jgi:hypothetical protein
MNEELQKNTSELIEWLKTSLESSQQFVIEQAPIYVQELLWIHFWSNLVYGSIWLVTLLFSVILTLSGIRNGKKTKWDWGNEDTAPEFFIKIIIGGAVFVFTIFGSFLTQTGVNYFLEAAKAKMTPRVVIVEHIQNKFENEK